MYLIRVDLCLLADWVLQIRAYVFGWTHLGKAGPVNDSTGTLSNFEVTLGGFSSSMLVRAGRSPALMRPAYINDVNLFEISRNSVSNRTMFRAQGVGGAVPLADGYLPAVYKHIRDAGGLCIADEVQTGFGRTGTHYWGFQNQGVTPDIVTMAKVRGAVTYIYSKLQLIPAQSIWVVNFHLVRCSLIF